MMIMMISLPRRMAEMFLLLALFSSASCSSPVGVELRYYLLEPQLQTNKSPSDAFARRGTEDLSIEIRALSIPKYLARYQIARRSSENTIRYSELNQWGENLEKNLLRVMAMNLTAELGTADISTPINRLDLRPDYQLRIHIEKFEQGQSGEISLMARYQISKAGAESLIRTKQFEGLSAEVSTRDYSEMVAEMSRLLHHLSQDISLSLSQLSLEQMSEDKTL